MQAKDIDGVSNEVLSLLMAHQWPGNVRELENVIERAFVVCTGPEIEIACLPEELTGVERPAVPQEDMASARRMSEAQTILNALKRNHFNRAAAARELGIHKTTLYRKMKSLHLDLPDQDGRSK